DAIGGIEGKRGPHLRDTIVGLELEDANGLIVPLLLADQATHLDAAEHGIAQAAEPALLVQVRAGEEVLHLPLGSQWAVDALSPLDILGPVVGRRGDLPRPTLVPRVVVRPPGPRDVDLAPWLDDAFVNTPCAAA